ncbi:FRG domain-containing protein [Vibrio parahaemolyticus]|uniref:FRG domain-containing protein n=1 Tax=Vibrio parahaemolyticus TaxID=670 RepID=UPI0016552862|nr:FRG domain-containing protein [Vibrio parahaemolyticus]EGQ9060276.1 FRG domain-containing protein [Vibrio parahaemolyticus]MBC8664022.1 FRG domain-containing protein [Vibrio parahaemolyticus]MBC8664583.1 FRG domain-containing protein [Vibrio parahaemolyticus]MBC8664634.1 FRG domain-containing protein [Vibrio parahaemolyticus]MBC8664636.1 FRG domain-containing protein [Vibrio parahaemolyticus]
MAQIEEIYIQTWDDLSDKFNEYFTYFNNYIFRGQGSEKWKLDPSLTRMLKQSEYKRNEWQEVTELHLERFKENIRGRADIDFHSATKDEFWAIGQHFGLATPLLDWSRSPFVAAFFALNGCEEDDNCVVYALCEPDIERLRKNKSPNQRGVRMINPLTHYNDRLVNQKGLFLFVPTHIDLESWVRSGEEENWITMFKIVFPASIKNEVLAGLDNMNINMLSLFPDLHGSCLHTNFQSSIEAYLEKKRLEEHASSP